MNGALHTSGYQSRSSVLARSPLIPQAPYTLAFSLSPGSYPYVWAKLHSPCMRLTGKYARTSPHTAHKRKIFPGGYGSSLSAEMRLSKAAARHGQLQREFNRNQEASLCWRAV